MLIHIINRQKICKPNAGKMKAALRFFLSKAAPGSGGREISLVLMDDAGIRKIKRQFFDIDCVTDVISFAPSSRPAAHGRQPAEIVVNVERACLEGKQRRGLGAEFALYLAHGCDHLAGNNDRTLKARNKMRRRELRWIKRAAGMNLLSGLFGPARE